MSNFFIDDIIKSPYSKVKIDLKNDRFKRESIEGYLIDDTVAFDTSATYSTIGGDISNLASLGGSAVTALGDAFKLAGKAIGVGSPVAFTIKAWDESEPPSFDVGLLFVHARDGVDPPEKKVRILNSLCYPRFMDGLGSLQQSPMGYNPVDAISVDDYNTGSASSLRGTVILSIGKWFKAAGLLVTNASFEYSKECAPDGSPIYAQGKIQFVSHRMVSYQEYMDYFILADGGGGDAAASVREKAAKTQGIDFPDAKGHGKTMQGIITTAENSINEGYNAISGIVS